MHRPDIQQTHCRDENETQKFDLILQVLMYTAFLFHYYIFFVLKEPRHLQFIADFSDSDVYTVLSAKKLHGAPTDFGLCVKVPSLL